MSFLAIAWLAAGAAAELTQAAGQATEDSITWGQVNILIAAMAVFVALLGVILVTSWRFRREFGEKIDKLDGSIAGLSESLTNLRIITVSRGELDGIEMRLHEVELSTVRADTNIKHLAKRLGKLEE